MFIRRTKTRSAEARSTTPRLVRSERSGERVRQRTLLNLGSDFAVATEHWAVLCSRIQLLERQGVLVELECPEEVEREAQRIAMQLVQRGAEVAAGGTDCKPWSRWSWSGRRWGWSMWGCGRWSGWD